MSSKKNKNYMKSQSVAVILILCVHDMLAVGLAYFLALWLRFDGHFSEIPEKYLEPFLLIIPFYAVLCVGINWGFNLYKSLWRFAGIKEFIRITISTVISASIHAAAITLIFGRMPLSYYFGGGLIQFACFVLARFTYRFIRQESRVIQTKKSAIDGRVMIIGAGAAGYQFLKDINMSDKTNDMVCCMIDDDRNKWGKYISNVPIVGGRDDILKAAEDYKIDKIYLAIPTLNEAEKRDILNICKETKCELKTLPGLYQLVNGDVSIHDLKDVAIEDLLGRDQIEVDNKGIHNHIENKVVLVTGGGGSIGSELCRQIASHHPRMLIIFDVYENNAYDIQLELKKKYTYLKLEVLIGSVRDSRRINQVFEQYRPDIVYHAAAHKHVPLMEDSPCEAIKNNAIGTYKTAYAAMKYGCKRFVLISTDKAVNPTNIMGASKRICEMIVQTFDRMIKEGRAGEIRSLYAHYEDSAEAVCITDEEAKKACTEYAAVRFGNVLGSNGSVVPLFKRQIEAGGPVTVTHPDIIRYFMTIPEAVSLVLQASVYAHGGEIFVLDMGEPVKIDTMARNLIKLSGLKPDEDIQIVYTGLRPGEKLYEEKLMAEEGLGDSPNKLIHVAKPIEYDYGEFIKQLDNLMKIAYSNSMEVYTEVENVIGTYNRA